MPGALDWELEIRQTIKKSNGLVYVASEEAALSVYVRDELAIAPDRHIPVYAMWVRGDYWADCVPLGWGRTPYADGRGERFDGAVLSIIASLKRGNGGA
jgi:hypothetical protein